MSKTNTKKMSVPPMSKALVSDYESKVIKAYEDGEPTIKGMRLEMAFNLSRLYRGKAHKTAGYDSFTDYLTAVFPFKEVSVTQMATWARTADKFLSRKADGTLVNQIGDGWELSSLERLNSVPVDTIKAAISDGKLSPDMSQNEVKAWVSSLPKEGKPKVVTMYERVEEGNHSLRYAIEDENGAFFPDENNNYEGLKAPKEDEIHVHLWKMNDGAVYRFSVQKNGLTGISVWAPVKPEPKTKHPVGKTKEQLAAEAMAAIDPEVLKQLVANILG